MRIKFLLGYYFIYLSFKIFVASAKCLEEQQSLLLQLKNNLALLHPQNSPNYSKKSTKLKFWNKSTDCCNWNGVTFDNEGHVISLDLSEESIDGEFNDSSSLFSLLHLQKLNLAYNYFNSSIPSGFNKLEKLTYLNLSHARFVGQIPNEISHLTRLVTIDFSFVSDFTGSLQLDMFLKLRNLSSLDLSYNNLSVNFNMSSIPNFIDLRLASCNLKTYPSFLINQTLLIRLDLSDNQIEGIVPNWIWKLQHLDVLNISHNFLTDFEGPMENITSNLVIVDIHNNQLQGSVPLFPNSVGFLDYSTNNFSVVPQDIGNYLSSTYFLSLLNNNLQESIPDSLCKASQLQVLDISFNNISGTISPCLMTMTSTLKTLDLRNNNLNGAIPDMLPTSCIARTLSFHGNNLHGPITESISHCLSLKVLDIGSNQITGGFPCFLKNIATLSVLVLRNNRLHGSLECSHLLENKPWKMIQIVDIAFNNFNGKLLGKYFTTWERMMHDEDQQAELPNIITIFAIIDFSSNHFEGPIPELMMDFKAVQILNFSNYALSGEIPSTIGNLKQLESLDLSNNSLVGEIPVQIASLSFLSYLNLSFNHLVGKIPTGAQLQSLDASSFEGNYGYMVLH